jgi:hypothetical protein
MTWKEGERERSSRERGRWRRRRFFDGTGYFMHDGGLARDFG